MVVAVEIVDSYQGDGRKRTVVTMEMVDSTRYQEAL